MIIPLESLTNDTLTAIMSEFVAREGTDYGDEHYTLEEKIEQIKAQLITGTAVIVYSELHETVNIIPADRFDEEQE